MPDSSKSPKLILRTYQDEDKDGVRQLFSSTYYALVPEGIRRKLWAPMTWVLWFGVYSLLLAGVPRVVLGAERDKDTWTEFFIKLFLSSSWAAIGFILLYFKTERHDLRERVQAGLENDLKDPEVHYLNWRTDGASRERRPSQEQTPSHFWVLTVDDALAGMVALACYDDRVMNRCPPIGNTLQQFGASFFQSLGRPVPDFCKPEQTMDVFAEPSEPHTATLTRLAIENSYQNCGLSTLLISRLMTWAGEHGIQKIYAHTNELQMGAEQILRQRHGFKLVERQKLDWFGKYKATWVCEVQPWLEKNKDSTGYYKRK